MYMRNKNVFKTNVHADEQWRLILTSVEVNLLYLLCEKHERSLSEKAHPLRTDLCENYGP